MRAELRVALLGMEYAWEIGLGKSIFNWTL
ncbi:hypothetical protein LINPERHAP1_LOCUS38512 [Linum perenne]